MNINTELEECTFSANGMLVHFDKIEWGNDYGWQICLIHEQDKIYTDNALYISEILKIDWNIFIKEIENHGAHIFPNPYPQIVFTDNKLADEAIENYFNPLLIIHLIAGE